MAWPNSRLQDFIANLLPVIKATTLNMIQDWIVAISKGRITVLSLTTDAVGGNAVVPANDGDIVASRSVRAGKVVSATTTPTPAVDANEMGKGFVPLAWGRITGTTGALKRAAGVFSCTRTAQGVYTIIARGVPTDGTNFGTLVTPEIIGGSPIVAPQAPNAGRPVVQITIQVAGANTDADFSFAILGE